MNWYFEGLMSRFSCQYQLQYHWALLNIMIEGKLETQPGTDGDNKGILSRANGVRDSAAYGPYFVIFGKYGKLHAIYLVKDGSEKFFEEGLKEAVKLGFMTPEKALEVLNKVMTYDQFKRYHQNMPDIVEGKISPAGVMGIRRSQDMFTPNKAPKGAPAALLRYMHKNGIYKESGKTSLQLARQRGRKNDSRRTIQKELKVLIAAGLVKKDGNNYYLSDSIKDIDIEELIASNSFLEKPSPSAEDIAPILSDTFISPQDTPVSTVHRAALRFTGMLEPLLTEGSQIIDSLPKGEEPFNELTRQKLQRLSQLVENARPRVESSLRLLHSRAIEEKGGNKKLYIVLSGIFHSFKHSIENIFTSREYVIPYCVKENWIGEQMFANDPFKKVANLLRDASQLQEVLVTDHLGGWLMYLPGVIDKNEIKKENFFPIRVERYGEKIAVTHEAIISAIDGLRDDELMVGGISAGQIARYLNIADAGLLEDELGRLVREQRLVSFAVPVYLDKEIEKVWIEITRQENAHEIDAETAIKRQEELYRKHGGERFLLALPELNKRKCSPERARLLISDEDRLRRFAEKLSLFFNDKLNPTLQSALSNLFWAEDEKIAPITAIAKELNEKLHSIRRDKLHQKVVDAWMDQTVSSLDINMVRQYIVSMSEKMHEILPLIAKLNDYEIDKITEAYAHFAFVLDVYSAMADAIRQEKVIASRLTEGKAQEVGQEAPDAAEILHALEMRAKSNPSLRLKITSNSISLGFSLDFSTAIASGVFPVSVIKDKGKYANPEYFAVVDDLQPANYIVFKITRANGKIKVTALGAEDDSRILTVNSHASLIKFKAGRRFYENMETGEVSLLKVDEPDNAGRYRANTSFVKSNPDNRIKGMQINLTPVSRKAQKRYWLTSRITGVRREGETFNCLVDLNSQALKKPLSLPTIDEIKKSAKKYAAYPAGTHSARKWITIERKGGYDYYQNIGVITESGKKFSVYRRLDRSDRITAIRISPDRRSFTVEGLECYGEEVVFEAGTIHLSALLFMLLDDKDMVPAPAVKNSIRVSDSLRCLACNFDQLAAHGRASIPTIWRIKRMGDRKQLVAAGPRNISWLLRTREKTAQKALARLEQVRQELAYVLQTGAILREMNENTNAVAERNRQLVLKLYAGIVNFNSTIERGPANEIRVKVDQLLEYLKDRGDKIVRDRVKNTGTLGKILRSLLFKKYLKRYGYEIEWVDQWRTEFMIRPMSRTGPTKPDVDAKNAAGPFGSFATGWEDKWGSSAKPRNGPEALPTKPDRPSGGSASGTRYGKANLVTLAAFEPEDGNRHIETIERNRNYLKSKGWLEEIESLPYKPLFMLESPEMPKIMDRVEYEINEHTLFWRLIHLPLFVSPEHVPQLFRDVNDDVRTIIKNHIRSFACLLQSAFFYYRGQDNEGLEVYKDALRQAEADFPVMLKEMDADLQKIYAAVHEIPDEMLRQISEEEFKETMSRMIKTAEADQFRRVGLEGFFRTACISDDLFKLAKNIFTNRGEDIFASQFLYTLGARLYDSNENTFYKPQDFALELATIDLLTHPRARGVALLKQMLVGSHDAINGWYSTQAEGATPLGRGLRDHFNLMKKGTLEASRLVEKRGTAVVIGAGSLTIVPLSEMLKERLPDGAIKYDEIILIELGDTMTRKAVDDLLRKGAITQEESTRIKIVSSDATFILDNITAHIDEIMERVKRRDPEKFPREEVIKFFKEMADAKKIASYAISPDQRVFGDRSIVFAVYGIATQDFARSIKNYIDIWANTFKMTGDDKKAMEKWKRSYEMRVERNVAGIVLADISRIVASDGIIFFADATGMQFDPRNEGEKTRRRYFYGTKGLRSLIPSHLPLQIVTRAESLRPYNLESEDRCKFIIERCILKRQASIVSSQQPTVVPEPARPAEALLPALNPQAGQARNGAEAPDAAGNAAAASAYADAEKLARGLSDRIQRQPDIEGPRSACLYLSSDLIADLHTTDLEKIRSIIAEIGNRQTNERSQTFRLEHPIVRNGRRFEWLKLKGVSFDPHVGLLPHLGSGQTPEIIVPDAKGGMHVVSNINAPEGGSYLLTAFNEFVIHDDLARDERFKGDRVHFRYPVGWGQFKGLTYNGKSLGFVILALESIQGEERDLLDENIYKERGRLLRLMHERGYTGFNLHEYNCHISTQKFSVLWDFENTSNIAREPQSSEEYLAAMMIDLSFAAFKAEYALRHYTGDISPTLAVAVLKGYFEKEMRDGVVSASDIRIEEDIELDLMVWAEPPENFKSRQRIENLFNAAIKSFSLPFAPSLKSDEPPEEPCGDESHFTLAKIQMALDNYGKYIDENHTLGGLPSFQSLASKILPLIPTSHLILRNILKHLPDNSMHPLNLFEIVDPANFRQDCSDVASIIRDENLPEDEMRLILTILYIHGRNRIEDKALDVMERAFSPYRNRVVSKILEEMSGDRGQARNGPEAADTAADVKKRNIEAALDAEPYLGDISKPDAMVKNLLETIMSILISQSKGEDGQSANIAARRLVLAFHKNLKGFQSGKLQILLRQLDKLKQKEGFDKLLKNLEIISFASQTELTEELGNRHIALGKNNNLIFTFAPEDEAPNISISGPEVHAILVKEAQAFRPETYYYPLFEIVTISLVKYQKDYSVEEIRRVLSGFGIADLSSLNIATIQEGNGAFLIFSILPRIERYAPGDRVERYVLLNNLLTSAA